MYNFLGLALINVRLFFNIFSDTLSRLFPLEKSLVKLHDGKIRKYGRRSQSATARAQRATSARTKLLVLYYLYARPSPKPFFNIIKKRYILNITLNLRNDNHIFCNNGHKLTPDLQKF